MNNDCLAARVERGVFSLLASYAVIMMLFAPIAYASSSSSTQMGAGINGEYTIAVTLEGDTGELDVSSPTRIVIKDGDMKLTVVWNSESVKKMIVEDSEYLPINSSGVPGFEIPVSTMDGDVAIGVEDTSSEGPQLRECTLHLDGSSMKESVPDWSGMIYIGVGVVLVVVAIIVGNRFRK